MPQGFKDKVVVITEASERRSGILDGARPTSEDDTATTFELFFDLVYVFAMTQVTGYMVHAHDALGVLQGLLVLALLWWTWCAYAWLGNQARADTGVVLLALPAAAYLPPLAGLAGLVLLLGVLIGVETRRYAALRAGVRPG